MNDVKGKKEQYTNHTISGLLHIYQSVDSNSPKMAVSNGEQIDSYFM